MQLAKLVLDRDWSPAEIYDKLAEQSDDPQERQRWTDSAEICRAARDVRRRQR